MDITTTRCFDLANEIDIQADSTISRPLHQDDRIKAVLFGFDAGQELSEHTASVAAIMHFIEGAAEVTVDGERSTAGAGSYFYLEPKVPHSIAATEPTKMLLLLLKGSSTT